MRRAPHGQPKIRERARQIGLIIFHLAFADGVAQVLLRREKIYFCAFHGGLPSRRRALIEHAIDVTDRTTKRAASTASGVLIRNAADRFAIFDAHDLSDRALYVRKRG